MENMRAQIFLSMRPIQTEPFKCAHHARKEVEFHCKKENVFFCSLCMLEHAKHNDDIFVATQVKILEQYKIVADYLDQMDQKVKERKDHVEKIRSGKLNLDSS